MTLGKKDQWVLLLPFSIWIVIMFSILLHIAGCAASCVDDSNVINAVEKAGYANAEILAKHYVSTFFGCSKDDAAAFEVIATNANKQRVKFIACAGWPFKGVTIRF
jgi:hypothetical protein